MKKPNNRFRSGNNNNVYTLNYKFDSVSIAGKISGTALDLIRRYNDLAKEAQANGDYVDMEIYRQYAEHYRKIVTDINERRQSRYDNKDTNREQETVETENASEDTTVSDENISERQEPVEAVSAPNGYVETLPATEQQPAKSFQVVEINDEKSATDTVKPKRAYHRRTSTTKKVAEA